MQMFRHLVLLCLVQFLIMKSDNRVITHLRQRFSTRCTRRFSPGVCAQPVSSVWTFEFFTQNCTERLGCKISTTSNRFISYDACMKKCDSLLALYVQTIAHDEDNSTRSQKDLSRRRVVERLLAAAADYEENSEKVEVEAWDSPILKGLDRDSMDVGDVVPPDIDYTGAKATNEECDLLHYVRNAIGMS